MEAKKRLGQHFLINDGIAKRIAERLKDQHVIVEIGGGRGALTKWLLELEGSFIIVVEIDKAMIKFLKEKFKNVERFFLIRADGSQIKVNRSCAVCGNLPYNVSKLIIRNFILQYEFVEKMIFMVQKEVAQTIVAKSGSREFNKFSILCQLFYTVKKIFDVKPGSFEPPPKVNSSVVEFTKKRLLPKIDESFFSFLDNLFLYPRKTVKNNLRLDLNNQFASKRPSDLTLEEIIFLWRTKWQNR